MKMDVKPFEFGDEVIPAAYQIWMAECATGRCCVKDRTFFVFPQVTTGTPCPSPRPRPTCTSPPSRVRPAPTSPCTSRPVHLMASSWKTWATPTSSAWSSNVRGMRVMLCAHESFLSLLYSLSHCDVWGLIQQQLGWQCWARSLTIHTHTHTHRHTQYHTGTLADADTHISKSHLPSWLWHHCKREQSFI